MAKKITQEYVLKVVASGLREVTKEIKTLNSNITGMDSSVEKSGESFKKTGKSQNTYIKNAKGVGHVTNNGTKAFSKMSQGMQGTLVPAYAQVAANVFALSAAFGALKRAADLQILINSAEAFAVQTGRSLITLSGNMKDITNNALTMKDALESASIAASAGFDNSTIEKLTEVARNASVALGRDMTDSLNRVFKGAIKAEPELLDELGIILRLDTATRDYAAVLGKAANALTTFEKQQAVVNAVIKQGEDKFSEFAEVDVNPYTKLAASFQDISASLITLISVPVTPVLTFLSENVAALTAVIVLFSASVLKRAFPALENFAEVMETKMTRASRVARVALWKAEKSTISFHRSLQGTNKDSIEELKNFEKGVFQVQEVVQNTNKRMSKSFTKAFDMGNAPIDRLKEYRKGIKEVLVAFDRGTQMSQGYANTTENVAFLTEELGEADAVLNNVKNSSITATNKLQGFGKGLVGTFAKARSSIVAFGAEIARSASAGAFAGYTKGFKGISEAIKVVSKETTGFTRVASIATTGIAGMGGAFLKMLPLIGQLVFAWSLLSTAFSFIKDAFVEKSLVDLNATLEDNTEALTTAAKSAEYFNNKLKELPDTIDNTAKKARLLSNTFGTLSDNLSKTLKDINIDKGFSSFDSFLDAFGSGNLDEFKDQLEELAETTKKFGFREETNKVLKEFNTLTRLGGEAAILAGEKLLKHLQAIRDNARGAVELNNLLKESITGLSKGITVLSGTLPTLTGVEQGFFALQTILATIDTSKPLEIVSVLEKFNNLDLRNLGLEDIAKDISRINKPITLLQAKLKETESQLKSVRKISFNPFNIKQTAKDFARLSKLTKDLKTGISELQGELGKQSTGIVKALDLVVDRFQLIIDAQEKIADIRAQNAVSNLEQGKGLNQRLSLLTELQDAEASYVATITSQTSLLLIDVQGQISSTVALLNEAKNSGDEKKKNSVAGLQGSLASAIALERQLENKLLKDRNKIVNIYIKQVKAIQQELGKTTKLAAAGLTVSKEQAAILKDKLYDSHLKIAIAQKKTIDQAKEYAARMTESEIAAQEFLKFLLQARIPSVDAVLGNITSLKKRSEVIKIENEHLANTGNLLSNRIDKEFILNDALAKRQLLELEARAPAKDTDEAEKTKNLIESLNLQLEQSKQTRDDVLASAKTSIIEQTRLEIESAKTKLSYGALVTKAQLEEIARQEKLNELKRKGIDTEGLVDPFKELADIQFAQNITDQLGAIVDSLNPYIDALDELDQALTNSEVNNFSAALLAMSKISKESGDTLSESIFNLSIAFETFAKKFSDPKNVAGLKDYLQLASTAIGAVAGAYEEGSEEAKKFAKIQATLAVISAVVAVLEQGKGDSYTAFGRIAAMIGVVTSVLSAANLAFGGASGSTTGASDYESSVGSQGLVGVDLETNSLVDSIDDLVSINTELFSAERSLQIAINNLSDVFLNLILGLTVELGGFTEATATKLFGTVFGSQTNAIATGSGQSYTEFNESLRKEDLADVLINNLVDDVLQSIGFSSKKINQELLDFGIQFGASIEVVNGVITGTVVDSLTFLVNKIETTTNDWWGLISKTNTRLETSFQNLSATLDVALDRALNNTLSAISSMFSVLGDAVSINLGMLFSGLTQLDIEPLAVSLLGKTLEEQQIAISAWFTNLGNTVIGKLVPFITKYSEANETLLDTLIRVTNTIIQLSGAFRTIDLDISFIADVSTIDTSKLTGNINSAVEALKLEMVFAWEAAFLKNFKDFNEFSSIFANFSNAIFSETELLDIAVNNATTTVESGFGALRGMLVEQGQFDLLSILDSGTATSETLRSIYELASSTNAFATVVDAATGAIDTSGADLFATVIQLGDALNTQQNLTESLAAAIDNLNLEYERQIALFGLVGKELELLSLSFDFQDAIKEAKETGTDIALVETLYGLERLDIIRKYNDQIVDALDSNMTAISDAILTVLRSAEGWNEVMFQSGKATKIADKLAASLGSLGTDIDFTVFSDTADAVDFLTSLEKFIDTTAGSGDSITDQINLVSDLREAVVSTSQALEESITNSIDALKDLSLEINNFLDDLFVGDLSPLTNAQKLAEAQTQFDTNLNNVLSEDTALAEAARSDLLDSANTLLELGNLFWAVGPEYQAIFNNVVGSLESIDQSILAEIGLSEETLAINSLEASLTDLQLQTITQLQTLDSILMVLETQNAANLSSEIGVGMPEVVGNLDAILMKLEQVNNDSWNPIYLELVSLNNTMSGMNSFASGSSEISYDQVAMIHKGETILTAKTSDSIRSGESIYGSADVATGFSGTNTGTSSEVVDAIRILTQVVASGNEDIIDKNEEVRLATRNISTSMGSPRTASAKGIV